MAGNRRQSGIWVESPAHNGDDIHYTRQSSAQPAYYQPSSSHPKGRSFSERAAGSRPTQAPDQGSGLRHQPLVSPPTKLDTLHRGAERHPELHSADQSGSSYGNMPLPRPVKQRPARVEPPQDDEDVPENMRSKPWSPEPLPLNPQQKPARQASNASKPVRRGSVPERSPLQKLEYTLDDIGKEEKRARMKEAEDRSRRREQRKPGGPAEGDTLRTGTMRTDKARVVSDGSRRPSQREAGDGMSRHASTGGSHAPGAVNGAAKMRQAQDALRNGSPEQEDQPADGLAAHSQIPDTRAYGGEQRRAARQRNEASFIPNEPVVDRSRSERKPSTSRDIGVAGAGAAATISAAERGKAAHDRRKGGGPIDSAVPSPNRGSSQDNNAGLGRSHSKKLQKRQPAQPTTEWRGKGDNYFSGPQEQPRGAATQHGGKPILQDARAGAGSSRQEKEASERYDGPDPVPRDRVQTGPNNPVPFQVPPQTIAGQQAREQVGFENAGDPKQHNFREFLHRSHSENRGYVPSSKPLEDWRNGPIGKLSLADLDLDHIPPPQPQPQNDQGDATWWEKKDRRASTSAPRQSSGQYEGPYEEEAQSFRPALFLKCGPLLRYTGMRQETARTGGKSKEIWRGSVMIVTENAASEFPSPPVLRMFAQPMELHEPPSAFSQEIPPEEEDPISGQVKVSRTGRPLYVRPAYDLEPSVDLSREENNYGLFSATRTPLLGPQSASGSEDRPNQNPRITFQDKSRIKARDGERLNKYREVKAHRLHTERGVTFWRFNLEIELGPQQTRIAYRINKGPAIGFWVPPRGETMNIMFHSCNGFSLAVEPDNFSGPDPLWRDVMNRHQRRPFHVMLGGGDQIYNDAAMRDTELFREWLQIKNPERKHGTDFSEDMQEELEDFYLDRYAMWFSQGLFGMANSQIPMVNIWDDHDIIDGYGSYPHHFMSNRVFTGLGAVAFKYYMLFQHQSLVAETTQEEPSWLLGASPGPYINELSRSVFMFLGKKVAFLGLDCRTERMRDEVLSQESYDVIFDRCRAEIVEGETKHLLVMLGVPIAYPRLNFLENLLTSRVMDPVKAIGRTGALGGFINKFDGGVEILDDLDDHWTAKHHKAERNWFIQELQELAAEKSVRVTILGGDVHLGAVGQFYSNKKLGIPKDQDHRYMPNVVSSAIVNTPPPVMMADVLNKRNKIHHLDPDTDEDMIPMFERDVDGSKRNNMRLLPRRNFCVIKEYHPGHTPSPSPQPSQEFGERFDEGRGRDGSQYPPSSMKRTMSLSGAPGRLVRRFSGSRNKNPPMSLNQGFSGGMRRSNSQGSVQGSAQGPLQRSSSMSATQDPNNPAFDPRAQFRRRPTNLSVKEARKAVSKGGPDDGMDGRDPAAIDLEGGLDVSLCMEVDQKDPAGRTEPYRLLVPALWYQGPGDPNTAPFRKPSIMERIRGRPSESQDRGGVGGERDRSRSMSPDGPPDGRSLEPGLRGASMDAPRGYAQRGASMDVSRGGAQRGASMDLPHGHSQRGAFVDFTRANSHRGELDDLQATAAAAGAGAGAGPVRGPSQRRTSMSADRPQGPPDMYREGFEGQPPPIGSNGLRTQPPTNTYRQGYEGAPPPIGEPGPGPNKLQRNNSMPASGYRRPSFTGGRLGSLFGRNKRKAQMESENYRDEYFNHHTPPRSGGGDEGAPVGGGIGGAGGGGRDERAYEARGSSLDYYDDDSLPYSDEEDGGYDSRPLPVAGQPRAQQQQQQQHSQAAQAQPRSQAQAPLPVRRPSKAERFLGLEAGEENNRAREDNGHRMSLQGGRSTLEEGRWEGPGYDREDGDYFGDAVAPKKKGWKGILGRG